MHIRTICPRKRSIAMKNRMGRIVKVYRNESKQTMTPKLMIERGLTSFQLAGARAHLLHGQRHAQEVANPLPFMFLMRVKVGSQKFLS